MTWADPSIIMLLLAAACSGIGPSGAPVAVPGCGRTHRRHRTPAAAADATANSAQANNTQYVIGAGDKLGISVYHAPELSVPGLPVRPDGRISMPLIPDIVAAGKTPTQLGKELEERLKEYIKDPDRHRHGDRLHRPVQPPGAGDRRGDRSGGDPVPRSHDCARPDDCGERADQIRCRQQRDHRARQVGEKRETIHVRLSDLIKNGDIDQNIELLPGDTLIIPQSWF